LKKKQSDKDNMETTLPIQTITTTMVVETVAAVWERWEQSRLLEIALITAALSLLLSYFWAHKVKERLPAAVKHFGPLSSFQRVVILIIAGRICFEIRQRCGYYGVMVSILLDATVFLFICSLSR
jgi:C4-dicarboxylate transporter